MELPFEDDDYQLDMTLRHSVPAIETHDKECVVCGLIQNEWEHYQYPCGHYGHSRCVRKWLHTTVKVQCPWCREQTPDKKYCHNCRIWSDHCDLEEDACPVIQDVIRQMYELHDDMCYKPPKKSRTKQKKSFINSHLGKL